MTAGFPRLAACAAALCLYVFSAQAAEPIGLIKTLTGTAAVSRDGATAPLAAGADVFSNDVVSTGPGSALGITFRDDTTLSMGEAGRVVLDSFAFDPAGEKVGMGVKLLKGTFAVVSGQIAKLAPEKMVVTTPTMSIGIRGTSFLVEVNSDE
jgi:Uncharacterized protein conserved in bacteria